MCVHVCVCVWGGGGGWVKRGYWLPGRDIDVRMEEDENVYLQRPIASQEEESHLHWKRTHGNKTRVRTMSMPYIQSPKHNK